MTCWDGIGFPFSHCFFIELENYGKKTSLLGKPMVQVLRNAEICLKTGISSDTYMLLYKCIYTLTIVTSNAVLCTNVFYCAGYWQPPVIIPRHTRSLLKRGANF